MGKHKQAQRTKNNTRPSSSSRSAELLGTSMTNFVGFSAVKDGGYVPVLPGLSLCSLNEVELNSVDSTFQVILKKMSKKDSTTKYKALQEFITLCQNAEMPMVESVLPFWPRIYCALAIDIDHRVREATQLAHAAVVKRVGKGIATYLKQLAGAWFTSQYDTYPPAASVAINSFNDTFPPGKIIDAIVFCQYEILMYISDNITVQIAQTQKALTSEEMEMKCQRLLVANLQGYSSYFKMVPLREIDKTLEIHGKILNSSKFWKLAKHDVAAVKIAFFNVLTSIMENATKLLESEKKKAVTAVINSLDESEPGILSAVWESMLVVVTKIDDWHLVVNIDKFVLPKLWRVLQSGGQCCASIVYPNLLPFISQFPKFNVDINNLYMNFFHNMRQGFSAKSVQVSRSEMLAVITAFAECIRYSIVVNAENVDLCIRLFKEQLMPIIETCITENISMRQICFTEITHLVRYWSKNRANEGYKVYALLMPQFWAELRLLFDKFTKDTTMSRNADARDAQIEFLLILKNAPDHTRKKLKVRFSEPNDFSMGQSEVKFTKADADTIFTAELYEFVNAICTIYFGKINDQHSTEYIGQLNKLLKDFASKELFVTLSESFKFDKDFFEFCDKNLRPLLLNNSDTIGQILDLTFYFITYASDIEKNKILNLLIELNDIAITKNVIYWSLSRRNRNDDIIKRWYTQASVTQILINVAKEILSSENGDLEESQNLILLAFETSENGDLLINEEIANEIVSILCNSLREINDTCSTQFIAFITKVMTSTWDHKQTISSAVQILETLFELCTREYNYTDLNFAATIRNKCKEGLTRSCQVLSRSEFNNLIKKCAVIIWSKIHSAHTIHVNDALIDLATDILDVIVNNNKNIESDWIEEIILSFLTTRDIKLWITEATTFAMYGEIVTGNLYVSNIEEKIEIFHHGLSICTMSDTILDNAITCFSWALYITDLLNNLHKRQASLDAHVDDTDISSNTKERESYDFNLPGITEVLVDIIYVATIANIYNKHYKSTKYYNDVNVLLNSLKNSFVTLQKNFAKITHNEVLAYIRMNYLNYGCMLPYIIRTYAEFEQSTFESPIKYYESCRNNEEELNEEAYVQAIQILNNYSMSDKIPLLTDNYIHTLIITRIKICLEDDNCEYADIVEKIMLHHKENPTSLFLDHDVSNVSWNQLLLPLEVIRLLTVFIQKVPSKLTYKHWDFILISLSMWQLSINKSKHNCTDIKVAALVTAVNQLYFELQILMSKHEGELIPELPSTFLDEWKNVFADDIYNNIVQTWMFCAALHNQDSTVKSTIALDYLGKAISILDKNILFKRRDKETKAIDFNEMLKLSIKLLQYSTCNIQLGAYHLLKHIASELVQYDNSLIESDNFEPSSLNFRKLEEVLLNIQNIVNTMLSEFKLCDTISCTIQPFTDSYTYTLGYLLTWAIVLDICANACGDLRYQYAEILKDDLFPCLLNNIFKLMPMEILQDNKNKTIKLLEIFTTTPSFNFEESWTEWRLDHIVCWVYTNCLRHLPVLVRQWWSTLDSKVSATIDKITSHHVSPMLCQEELSNKLVNIENMQIKVHPTTREVMALYQMDDTKLELSIALPSNYPLGTVVVESGQHTGGTANWRNCQMQLAIFLTHQNGSVWDGLVMWKRNLDKKFAGVEECCICFSIFHISTYQIPKLSCHTCRKKFHTPCLYKWFNTSQKSTCPICRNVF